MEVVFLLAGEQDLQHAYNWVAEHRYGKEQPLPSRRRVQARTAYEIPLERAPLPRPVSPVIDPEISLRNLLCGRIQSDCHPRDL